MFRRLTRPELPTDTATLARFLVGKLIVRRLNAEVLAGRIVETEAYELGDAAAHSFIGRTARNASLFMERGHAYVYRSYGIHWALNVSAETEGVGGGILLRALEPLQGIETMRRHRGLAVPDRDLARGPGCVSQALAVDRSLDGVDLCTNPVLFLAHGEAEAPPEIGVSTRIGITKEAHRKLRFFIAGNRFVSGPASLNRVTE